MQARTGRVPSRNTDGPAILAAACARRSWRYSLSHRLSYSMEPQSHHTWSSAVALLMYGHSKADAEVRVLRPSLGARGSYECVLWAVGRYNFLTVALRTLALGDTLPCRDALVSPPVRPCACLFDLLIDRECALHPHQPGCDRLG